MNASTTIQRTSKRITQELHGVIVIDKPRDISSAKAVALVKKIFNAKKAGHTGTLDPFAEGVLVCCLNDATRLVRFLVQGNKTYEAILKLGEETDTQDSTGAVVAVGNSAHLTEKSIRTVFSQFEGSIEQLPPVYSALKHKGVPLYRLARRGRPVQKPPRRVYISELEILNIQIPLIRFKVTCSAGTYIRTLGADIGKSLGCGAHLKALKRVANGGFSLKQAFTLKKLEDAALTGDLTNVTINMADALHDMVAHCADHHLIERIQHGHVLMKKDLSCGQVFDQIAKRQPFIKIVDRRNNLLAVLEYQKGKDRLDYCCVFPNSVSSLRNQRIA